MVLFCFSLACGAVLCFVLFCCVFWVCDVLVFSVLIAVCGVVCSIACVFRAVLVLLCVRFYGVCLVGSMLAVGCLRCFSIAWFVLFGCVFICVCDLSVLCLLFAVCFCFYCACFGL